MSETNPGPLQESKIKFAVTRINGAFIYAKSPAFGQENPGFIIYIHLSSILPTLLLSCKICSISNNSVSYISLLLNQARFAPVIP